jgi:hypothetical protein
MDPRIPGHPADRRLDDRVSVDGIEMAWGLARWGWGERAVENTARVINISRGGLLALVPRSRALRENIEVPIELCGGKGRVRVTYVRPSARRGWRLCGLDLVDGDLQLLAAIEQILSDSTGAFARAWAANAPIAGRS